MRDDLEVFNDVIRAIHDGFKDAERKRFLYYIYKMCDHCDIDWSETIYDWHKLRDNITDIKLSCHDGCTGKNGCDCRLMFISVPIYALTYDLGSAEWLSVVNFAEKFDVLQECVEEREIYLTERENALKRIQEDQLRESELKQLRALKAKYEGRT